MALNFPAYLAKAIRARMEVQDITELALHRATHIPRSNLWRRLNGHDEDFRSKELALIAQALGTTVTDLCADAERIEHAERGAA